MSQSIRQYRNQEDDEDRDVYSSSGRAMNTYREKDSTHPLSSIAEAFEELYELLKETQDGSNLEHVLRLDTFCNACSFVSVLFGCLGLPFKFAECEYVAKVHGLKEASKKYDTLPDVLDLDITKGTVKTSGSLSRNLRRVRQGLDLIRVLFENFLLKNNYTLKEVATTAYGEVFAPYHSWAVRATVHAGMYTLPTREQLLQMLNETNGSAEKKMRRYIDASVPVIDYIDNLYLSRNISLDW